jgi:PhzF family phenazine biosynthesis protein
VFISETLPYAPYQHSLSGPSFPMVSHQEQRKGFSIFLRRDTPMRYRFYQIDVFGAGPYAGNPLAVVADAETLSTEDMARFASWTNLSETTFILPGRAGGDYRIRIFSLDREYPFAGHPTLGSCRAWLASGGIPKRDDQIIQECGAGLVAVRRTAGGLAFAAPPLTRTEPVDEKFLQQLAGILRIRREEIVDSRWLSEWVTLLLQDADTVLAIEPTLGPHGADLNIGIAGPYPVGSECSFEVRAWFSDTRGELREDPATGGLNACLAEWLFATERANSPYAVSQGTRVGRESRLHMSMDADGAIWVAGATTVCISGEVEI